MDGLPREIIVVGAGVVGLEYASFLAALGTEVTLIDQRPMLLDFVDREIMEALAYHLRQMGTTFRLGEKVTRVGIDAAARPRLRRTRKRQKSSGATCFSTPSAARPMAISSRLEAAGIAARPARQDQSQRPLSDRRSAHLRGRRHHRLPRARQHVHGTRPSRELAACSARPPSTCRNCSPSASTRSPKFPWSAKPKKLSPRENSLRSRHREIQRAREEHDARR